MTLFNKYAEYDAKAEAARREALMKKFLDSDEIHLIMVDEINEEDKNKRRIENENKT